jgi:hypothetical protein
MANQQPNSDRNVKLFIALAFFTLCFPSLVLGLVALFIVISFVVMVLHTVLTTIGSIFNIPIPSSTKLVDQSNANSKAMSTEDYLRSLVKDDAAVDRMIRDSRRKYANRQYIWHIEQIIDDWQRGIR